MLNIAAPALSPREWDGVRAALGTVADHRCGATPAPGSWRDRIGRIGDAIMGHERPVPPSPRQVAVRDFLCASGRAGRIAEAHVPVLAAYGYNRAQIEAMALLGA